MIAYRRSTSTRTLQFLAPSASLIQPAFPYTAQRRAGLFAGQHHLHRSEVELGAAPRIRPGGFIHQLPADGARRKHGCIRRANNQPTPDVLPGLEIKNFGYFDRYSPNLNIGPAGVPGAFVNMGYYQNRVNPSTNVIFTAGHHTIVAGGGYSYTQLNITNNRTGHAQLVVGDFDSFLQGQVRSSSVLQSIDPTTNRNNANRYYRTNEFNGYVQDKWQALSNLSITAGVRYDYHGGMTEKYGNFFNFDPALYDVTGTTTTGSMLSIPDSSLPVTTSRTQPRAFQRRPSKDVSGAFRLALALPGLLRPSTTRSSSAPAAVCTMTAENSSLISPSLQAVPLAVPLA